MKGKVRYMGSAPKGSAKAVQYADIKGQGRIPYGKTADAPVAGDKPGRDFILSAASLWIRRVKTRGTGAATKGTHFMGL